MLTIGENEDLIALAAKLLETYTIQDLLAYNDIEEIELIYKLLVDGLIDLETPTEL